MFAGFAEILACRQSGLGRAYGSSPTTLWRGLRSAGTSHGAATADKLDQALKDRRDEVNVGQANHGPIGESGDEDGFVFGGGEEERTFAGPGIGYPFQSGAQGRPICCCFVAEFADVAGYFGTTRGGGERSRDCAGLVESIDGRA